MLPILSIPFHCPWQKIASKQTAVGCSCKQNAVMSMRNYHSNNTASFFLCNRSTTASLCISDHKNYCEMGSRTWTRQCLRRGEGGGGVRCSLLHAPSALTLHCSTLILNLSVMYTSYTYKILLCAECVPVGETCVASGAPTPSLLQISQRASICQAAEVVNRGCRNGKKKNSECPIRPTMAVGG